VPLRPLDRIDLNRLARTDPQAAAIGRQLQRAPGANRDGNPAVLRRDEFMAVAPLEHRLNVPLRPVLERLDRAFFAETGTQVTWNPPPLITASALQPIVQGGLPMPGVTFTLPSGAQTTFISKGDTGEVFRSDAPFATAKREPFVAAAVAGVTAGGRRYLYSVEPGAAGLSLVRREVTAAGLGRPQPVELSPMPDGMHWPQLTALPDGRIALAAVVPHRGPYLAISSDGGASFEVTAWLGQTQRDELSLAHLGSFADGTLVVTTQVGGPDGLVTSLVRTSRDGVNFSPPVPVTTENPNVHDAFVVRRGDGDVDLYYLRQEQAGFSAYRRKLTRSGSLGEEQRLTGPELGSVEKPQAFRLPDGSLRLIMARRNRLDDFDVVTALLRGDAP